jgi:hypothetical protein
MTAGDHGHNPTERDGIESTATGSHGRNTSPAFQGAACDGSNSNRSNYIAFELERWIIKPERKTSGLQSGSAGDMGHAE